MCRIARHKCSVVVQRSRRDYQIRIIGMQSVFPSFDPHVCASVEYVITYGNDKSVLTELMKANYLPACVLLLETTKHFVTGNRRNGKLVVLPEITGRSSDDVAIYPFEHLRKNVCVEQAFILALLS